MENKLWRHFDYTLFTVTALLVMYGVAVIYSASYASSRAQLLDAPAMRQLVYACIGFVLMLLAVRVDYRMYGSIAVPLYLLMVASLVGVLTVGIITHGSRRWFDVGLFPIQPSEVSKIILILVLAKFLADRQHLNMRKRLLLASLAIALVPAGLIYMQPDLGNVLVLGAIWLGMVIMAGLRLSYILGLLFTGVLAIPFIYLRLLHGYMKDRIATFLDPASDPLGAGFNVLQSEISVGSGGWFGKGFMNGTQSQLRFLRVPTTDFIFSVLGEELGFVGAAILFLLFTALLFRGLRVANLAQDTYGRLVATGFITMLLTQVFINVGVNTRLLPVTGITLPLISYGGSSLITMLFSLGILQSIVARHKKLEF